MDEIEMRTEELKDAIRRSNEYTQYQILWEEICRNQPLRDRINQLRRQRFLLDMRNDPDVIGGIEQISRDFGDILEQSVVKDFIAAEQRISKKIRYIENSILEAANINVEFMD